MPHPITDDVLVELYGPNGAARRDETERLVDNAVELALSHAARFDLLPPALEQVARSRWEERLRNGEGAPGVERFVGSSGARR